MDTIRHIFVFVPVGNLVTEYKQLYTQMKNLPTNMKRTSFTYNILAGFCLTAINKLIID